jgi:hypothetical protein
MTIEIFLILWLWFVGSIMFYFHAEGACENIGGVPDKVKIVVVSLGWPILYPIIVGVAYLFQLANWLKRKIVS